MARTVLQNAHATTEPSAARLTGRVHVRLDSREFTAMMVVRTERLGKIVSRNVCVRMGPDAVLRWVNAFALLAGGAIDATDRATRELLASIVSRSVTARILARAMLKPGSVLVVLAGKERNANRNAMLAHLD